MSTQTESPVFYDPDRKRWKYYKWTVATVSFILTVAFIATVFSVAKIGELPSLPLSNPVSVYRERPITFKSTGNKVKTQLNANSPVNNKNSNSSNIVPSNYKPKLMVFYVNWDDTSLTSLKTNIGNIDELVPEWIHLSDEQGNIAVDDQDRQNLAMDFIKSNRPDLPITPLINNYDSNTQSWNGDKLGKMLGDPGNRTNNINKILEFVQSNKFSGISIDYESVPKNAQPDLLLFMKELYSKFHPLGLEVSMNIPVDDNNFNTKSLAEVSDFLILMAYDEHSDGDSPGPVASEKWFLDSIAKRFSEVPSEKYVVALGNYGYDWEDKQKTAVTYTFQDAIRVARESQGKIVLDPNNLNETYEYYDDNNIIHKVFLLDAVTAFNEIVDAGKYKVGGYALWRMGSEDPSIWQVFKSRQTLSKDVAMSLQNLDYGYDIDYEGTGEILRVATTPKTGSRTVTYDDKTGLITNSEVKDFPFPYIINRWGGEDKKKIALTFDDGPDPVYTPQILKIFDQYNVKGTFFVIGMNATQNQQLLKQVFDKGNEIGNHTFTHPNIANISDSQVKFELNTTESLLASALGRHTLLFRPPYAEDVEPENPDQVKPLMLVNQLGYYTVGMKIDPKDWSSPGIDNIVNSVITGAENGDGNIVLLHDGGGDRTQTIAALPRIIEGLQSRGFQLVKVSDLVGVLPDKIMPKVSGAELILSDFSYVAFSFVNWIFIFLSFAFTIGIFLGLARFIFVGVLALFQKIKSKFRKYPSIKKFHPSVSVVIPAYNEEKVIVKTVESILKSDYPDLKVIVIDDGSTDGTYQSALENFKDNQNVEIFTKSNGGKPEALNFGISKTEAEIVVTLDADTVFLSNTISKLVRRFADPKVGAVAGNAKVGNRLNILTYWQALEYITSQNLDRRAFEVLNCITVVPGSVGAWRREAILKTGGFSNRTLAEDADLTFHIIRSGYKVAYEDKAFAYTEAPDTVKGFIKQRFRWMYGTLQATWMHKDSLSCPGCRTLGWIALPNILIFQVLFPLISPLMDLTIVFSLIWVAIQKYQHPIDYSATFAFKKLFFFYLFFLVVDFITCAIAFVLERKEDWSLLLWMFLQRFFYRQLMYYVAIKVFVSVMKGKFVRWGNLERKGTVG